MPKTNTKDSYQPKVEGNTSTLTNSTFELVNWPTPDTADCQLNKTIFALQTTRLCPQFKPLKKNDLVQSDREHIDNSSATHLVTQSVTPFDSFNLGLHVGDNAEQVTENRNVLSAYIRQNTEQAIKVQWLEQVHGNQVAEVRTVDCNPIIADASITRKKNIALAIMTADCLPILLSNINGEEIAAIHGGWRPLAANIIEKTLEKMHSNPADIVAWLGPCIGNTAFEVGVEVKEAFTQQNKAFATAFVKQANDKYTADLHQIAKIQLASLDVKILSTLDECTYNNTDKYYSYRKEQVTGRMASIICRR